MTAESIAALYRPPSANRRIRTMTKMTKTQRDSVALVNRGRSAKERTKLRKFTALQVYRTLLRSSDPADPAAWGFRISLAGRHPYGGKLVVEHGTNRVSLDYGLLGAGGNDLRLIPYTGTGFVGPLQELLGFDREYHPEENTMWHFEIEDRAEHDPEYRALKGLIQESIADVHLLHDGSYCRPYVLRGEKLVEYRGREDNHVTVSGLDYFLKLKGAVVTDA